MSFYTSYEFLGMVFYFIDPFGGKIIPYWLVAIWNAYRVIFGVVLLGMIFFHWVAVFHVVSAEMETVNAISSISGVMRSNLALDVVRRVNTLYKFSVPYGICVGIISVFQVPVLATQLRFETVYFQLAIANSVLLIAFLIFFGIGFVIYGRKLTRIVSGSTQKRMKPMIWKVNSFCGFSVLAKLFITLWTVYLTAPWAQMAYYCMANVFHWPLTLLIYSIYAEFDIKRARIQARQYGSTQVLNTPISTRTEQ